MRILLIEDNPDLAANLGEFLGCEGHVVDYAADGPGGLRLARAQRYDAIVLDLGLPGLDGVELCRRLRRDDRDPVPVLMLTARDSERDTLAGFGAGADDYLTKPCSLPVLDARLRALQRRSQGAAGGQLQVADLVLDLHAFRARRGERALVLQPSALRLLQCLMVASPGLVTRKEAEFALWGDAPPENDGALRTQVHALRHAVDRDEAVKLIHTIHGLGYRIGPGDAP